MKLTILLTVFFLAGCINIYGPNKTEGQENKAAQPGDTGTSGGTGSTTVMNRKPAELLTDIGQYYQSQGITPQLEDVGSGIVAATGDDPALAREWLDCGTFQNSLNIIPHYRLVTQVWSAGEGSHITSLVTGVAGLTAPDGNDKVKSQECSSSGAFERGLEETLRK